MGKEADSISPKQMFLPGNDPENIAAAKEYQDAIERLKATLDARKNRMFDPSMMSMAAGFLAPTQTGGFGESLGKALGNYGTAQQAQAKEEQDLAQQGVTLAGQGMQFTRQKLQAREREKQLAGLDNAPPGAPPAVGPLSAPPPAAAGALTVSEGTPPAGGLTAAEGKPPAVPLAPIAQFPSSSKAPEVTSLPSDDMGAAFNTFRQKQLKALEYELGSPADIEELIQKRWKERISTSPTGSIDIVSGKKYPFGGPPVDVPVKGKEGTWSVGSDIAMQMSDALNRGDFNRYNELVRINIGDRKSTQEQARENKKQETLSESDTKAETTAREDFQTKNADAQNVINNMNSFRTFADDPDAKNMTGILANTKVSSAIAALVKSGVGANEFRVGIPAIEDVMRNADLKPDMQAKYRSFLMLAVQMQLDKERMMKGATSDRERETLANASIGPGDTPKAIRMKADLLTTAAKFQRQMYKEWKNSKMTATEFRDSDKFEQLNDQHQENLTAILKGEKIVPSSAKPVNTNLDALRKKANKVLED
jgi:hypothetical protein